MESEAQARVAIDNLLHQAGWNLGLDKSNPINVELELNIKDKQSRKGTFADYLLKDESGFPLGIIEAKKSTIDPLSAKEQARNYAESLGIDIIILSNGEEHYMWNLAQGNPQQIFSFPSQSELQNLNDNKIDVEPLWEREIENDYIALSQYPEYEADPLLKEFGQDIGREMLVEKHGLRFMRPYQLDAVKSIQAATQKGKNRYLLEMATGTGKTLTAAAIIKLFLQTGNAKRVLFLVDRLELEDQTDIAFKKYFGSDYTSVIYKEDRRNWSAGHVVVSTVQSFTKDDRYAKIFKPTDFDLVISDEAHRSISGVSRSVFEYFYGYKLGLTATPKDYLKGVEFGELDPREQEIRQLKSTYITFGCESGEPTFRYDLISGVTDGYLINPKVADCRTEITSEMLSEDGYRVVITENGEEVEGVFGKKDFEKSFLSENTNRQFVETFFKNALTDPIIDAEGERLIGKTLVFAVSQKHATKLTQIFNEVADNLFPGKYRSDFAVQVTSVVTNSQQFTKDFSNNKLLGTDATLEDYETSKARVCVTVGMMTTGYDCPDLLNLCMCRPIMSISEFIQIKGRGTRTHTFKWKHKHNGIEHEVKKEKQEFKIFDFFANFEYFDKDYDYDAKIEVTINMPTDNPGGGEDDLDSINLGLTLRGKSASWGVEILRVPTMGLLPILSAFLNKDAVNELPKGA